MGTLFKMRISCGHLFTERVNQSITRIVQLPQLPASCWPCLSSCTLLSFISSLKQSVPKDVPSLLEDKLAGLVNCYFLGVGFIEILRKVLMIQKHHIKYQMLKINFHSAEQWQ